MVCLCKNGTIIPITEVAIAMPTCGYGIRNRNDKGNEEEPKKSSLQLDDAMKKDYFTIICAMILRPCSIHESICVIASLKSELECVMFENRFLFS